MDYKGGESCKRVDVWVCRVRWGDLEAFVFSFTLNHHLRRPHPHLHPRGLAFSSPLCRFLRLYLKKKSVRIYDFTI